MGLAMKNATGKGEKNWLEHTNSTSSCPCVKRFLTNADSIDKEIRRQGAAGDLLGRRRKT
jgi:hypothetical protein